MEWTTPIWLALITLIQSVVAEYLRRRGQMENLACARCGSRAFKKRGSFYVAGPSVDDIATRSTTPPAGPGDPN